MLYDEKQTRKKYKESCDRIKKTTLTVYYSDRIMHTFSQTRIRKLAISRIFVGVNIQHDLPFCQKSQHNMIVRHQII